MYFANKKEILSFNVLNFDEKEEKKIEEYRKIYFEIRRR